MSLRLDWCSYQAAKYACEKYHYSGDLSAGRNVYIGVWEDGHFIGAIIFGMGSGNSTNGNRYGLSHSHEVAELTRVALTDHRNPVSKMVAIAIRLLKKQSPKLRLIISMADPEHDHVGSIYQAGNWIYTGCTKPDVMYYSNGEWVHHRTATSRGSAKGLPSKHLRPKHRYLMPLDDEMWQCIEPLKKPYPKREKATSELSGDQPEAGGATPTLTLQHDIAREQH